jgi:hypothetical protein
VPSNGQQFLKRMSDLEKVLPSLRFSIFGIGDAGYQGFNGASRTVHCVLQKRNLPSIMLDCAAESDVAVEVLPWTKSRSR